MVAMCQDATVMGVGHYIGYLPTPIVVNYSLSIRLKVAREKKGWSQQMLADISGVSQKTIAKIEARPLKKSTTLLIPLAKALGVMPEWLNGQRGNDLEPIWSDNYGLNNSLNVSTDGSITVRSHVQAGAWSEAQEWEEECFYIVEAAKRDGFPIEYRYGLEVRGDSMDKRFPEGTVLDCIPLHKVKKGIKALYEEKRPRYVIVEREHKGRYEATVKEIEFDSSGKVLLWPRSHNPDHQSPLIIADVNQPNLMDSTVIRVTALVVSARIWLA